MDDNVIRRAQVLQFRSSDAAIIHILQRAFSMSTDAQNSRVNPEIQCHDRPACFCDQCASALKDRQKMTVDKRSLLKKKPEAVRG